MTGTEVIKLIDVAGVPKDAARLVATLEQHGGSLKRFLAQYPNDQHEAMLACIEQYLAEDTDKSYQTRWNAAIRRNQVARLRLLQNRSLERLEQLTEPDPEGKTDWLVMSKEAAAHKMILSDLLAAQAHLAKQRLEPVDDDKDGDPDDVELSKIMEGA